MIGEHRELLGDLFRGPALDSGARGGHRVEHRVCSGAEGQLGGREEHRVVERVPSTPGLLCQPHVRRVGVAEPKNAGRAVRAALFVTDGFGFEHDDIGAADQRVRGRQSQKAGTDDDNIRAALHARTLTETGAPSLQRMHWEPEDDDAILRAGRWATGSPPAHPPEPAPRPEPDVEPEVAWAELEPIALDSPRAPKPPQPARQRTIALATMLTVLAGVAGFVTTWLVLDERATPVANAVDDGQILDGLIVQQSDLGFTDEVVPLRGGSDAVNEPTLNLCNGRYPTEDSRVARRQVAVFGVEGTPKLSTEAVTYDDVATSEQAFDEI